jgi:hypothetical protein
MILAPTLTLNTPARGYDADATAFAAASGATDVAALSAFVKGVKELGLWNNMVCWPLRSTQNAGTGTTAYSLGGLGSFNGTLVNGPIWTADGLSFDATNESVALPSAASLQNTLSAMFAFKPDDNAFNQRLVEYSTATYKYASFSFDGQNFAGITQGNKLNTTRSGLLSQNQNGSRLLSLGTWRASAFGQDDSSDSVYVNGALDAAGARTGLTARNPTGAASVREIFAVSTAMTGSFAATSTTKWSDAQVAALHSLYKSTLGTGLSLP